MRRLSWVLVAAGCATTSAPSTPLVSLRATGGSPVEPCSPACAVDKRCTDAGCVPDPAYEAREQEVRRRRGRNTMMAGSAVIAAGAVILGIAFASRINADPDEDTIGFVIMPWVGGAVTGAGLVTLIAGGLVYGLPRPAAQVQPAPQRSAVRVRPSLRPDHAGLALDVRF